MSFTSGLDIVFSEPGEFESMNCPVCGELMKVQRDCTGPTGWAEAMGRGGHPHDTFTCLNYDKDWHVQLVKMREYKARIPSAALRAIVEKEMQEILETGKPTIPCPDSSSQPR